MADNETKLEVGALSETGYVREENQDHMSGRILPVGHLYIVADGMGGHKGGALASELTDKGLQEFIAAVPANAPVNEVLRNAFQKANETVYKKAHSGDPATEGMGSTAVVVLISAAFARVAHVGDSRAYLYRNKKLTLLTKDHTIVQKMVDSKMITPEEAIDHPSASVLERAIGTQPSVAVDVSGPIPLKNDDTILMCSDGLSGYVADAAIESVMREELPAQELPKRLVALALKKGGDDNITVQVIRYGKRKPTPDRSKKKPTDIGLRSTMATVLLLLLAAAVSAGATYLYQDRKLSAKNEALKAEEEEKQEQIALVAKLERKVEKLQREKSDVQKKAEAAAKGSESTNAQLKEIKQKLQQQEKTNEKLEKEKKILYEDLSKVKKKEDEYRQNADIYKNRPQLLVMQRDPLAEQQLSSDAVLQFVRDFGPLEIQWLEKNRWPKDLPVDQLPDKSRIYYTKSLGDSVSSGLKKHLIAFAPAEYGTEKASLEDILDKTFGTHHILLYLKSATVETDVTPAEPVPGNNSKSE